MMEANNDTAIHFELLAEERQAKAEQNRRDAERYRKLKAKLVRTRQFNDSGNAVHFFVCQEGEFDSAVDALETN